MKFIIFFFAAMMIATFSLAQVAPAPAPAVSIAVAPSAPAAPSSGGVLGFLANILAAIPGGIPTVAITVIGIVSELVMRIFPTAQPLSWFLFASALFHALGGIFDKLSSLLDSVIPQIKK